MATSIRHRLTRRPHVGPGNRAMKLAFQGWSRDAAAAGDRRAVRDRRSAAAIRVGQPVTVTAQRGDMVTGIIIGRDAIVRGGNGETVVWCHVEPEQFEARPVRTEPFDATRVIIAAGVD